MVVITKRFRVPGDSLKSGRRQEEKVGGIRLERIVSPFDRPTQLITHLDDDRKRLIIDVQYVDEEPRSDCRQSVSEGIVVTRGRYSQKILSIEVQLTAPSLHLSKLFTLLRSLTPNELNSEVTAEALEKGEEVREYLDELVPS